MAKGQHLTSYQRGIVNRYYEHRDTAVAQKLAEMVSDLYVAGNAGSKAAAKWEQAGRTLAATAADPAEAARVVKSRDIEGLARLVQQLTSPTAKPAPQATSATPATAPPPPAAQPDAAAAPAAAPATPGVDGISPDTLKQALKAFKKRLKLTKLDEESKLGRNPLTSGARSGIVAITPPNQYPRAVWDALVAQGYLKTSGRGFYELTGK